MGAGKWVLYAGLATGGIITIRMGLRIARILAHHEEQYHWLLSIIPPTDYNFQNDIGSSKQIIAAKYPELQGAVDDGTLCVLTRPADFDRALPEELYILGTAHVSRKTAQNVYDTILAVKPDAVVVELCRSRAFMMYRDAPLEEAQPEVGQPSSPSTQHTNDPAPASTSSQDAGSTGEGPTTSARSSSSSSKEAVQPAPGSRTGVAEGGQPKEKAKGPPAPGPSLNQLLQAGIQSLQAGQSVLHTLFGLAYMKIEAQLQTMAGLEFIRVRQAVEVVDAGRTAATAAAAAVAGLEGSQSAATTTPAPNTSGDEAIADQKGLLTRESLEAEQVHEYGSEAAERGLHTHIYYGDVPLNRTVSRAWGVLRLGQKLRLAWTLLCDIVMLDADEAMLEELLQEDVFQLLQRELGSKFPEIMGPLLHERNWQLAYTVHQAAQHGMQRVVLVVGRGHVPGVVYCLMHPYRTRMANKAWHASRLSEQGLAQEQLNAAATLPAGTSP